MTNEERFWQWFVAHSDKLLHFELDQETIFDELIDQLRLVHTDLTFEFGPLENEKREFIISADGIQEGFPAVQSLASSAPLLNHWTIIPFRPPRSLDFTLQIGDYYLSPKDIWFSHEPDGDLIGLTLYLPSRSLENEELATQATFILLDTALGEYDVETRVGFIDTVSIPANRPAEGLLPFTSIREVFDQLVP